MYIIIAILLFGILIAAHEWGHFIAARLCGVTVHEFAIGMGPALWQHTGKKGTQFSVRALPIGGYCAMEGEEEESDDPHSLGNQGFWKKTFVFAAGALMNFLVGVVIIFLLFVDAGGFYTPEITGFAPEFTLQGEDGLMEGDILYSIDGERIYLYNDVSMFLSRGDGDGFDLVVLRNGEKVTLENFPLTLQEYTSNDGETKYTGYGLYFGAVEEATFPVKLKMTWLNAVDFVRIVRYSLQELLTGGAGIQDLNGPVGIVGAISEVGQQSPSVLAALENIAYFGAMLAVNLAVVNLLPIPALDGGRIFFLVISTISLRVFRKKIPMKYEAAIHFAGFALLMVLILVVTFNDVVRLFG